MKNLRLTVFALTALLLAGAASAQTGSSGGVPATGMAAPARMLPATASTDMADGEIRKVDAENKKLTIKHGVIKNLDMPAMTMVFQVKDAVLLEKVKTGDKVRFRAEAAGGSAVVTEMEVVK